MVSELKCAGECGQPPILQVAIVGDISPKLLGPSSIRTMCVPCARAYFEDKLELIELEAGG